MANLLGSPIGNLDVGGCAILGIFPPTFAGSFLHIFLYSCSLGPGYLGGCATSYCVHL